ncbi:MAG: transposase [Rhodothermales bacterium]
MKKHSPQQIVTKLRKAEALITDGATQAEAAKAIGISEPTFYRWKNQYGSLTVDQAKRLKELEKENTRLKRLLAERDLDVDMLREAVRGKF